MDNPHRPETVHNTSSQENGENGENRENMENRENREQPVLLRTTSAATSGSADVKQNHAPLRPGPKVSCAAECSPGLICFQSCSTAAPHSGWRPWNSNVVGTSPA